MVKTQILDTNIEKPYFCNKLVDLAKDSDQENPSYKAQHKEDQLHSQNFEQETLMNKSDHTPKILHSYPPLQTILLQYHMEFLKSKKLTLARG